MKRKKSQLPIILILVVGYLSSLGCAVLLADVILDVFYGAGFFERFGTK